MNLHHLGEEIDIHGGGTDLIFPHHENEIAQTESLTGKRFARYWVHNGMLQFSGDKMSKSIGNIITIEEFLEQHDPDTLRMMVLNASYRSPLIFKDEVVAQAESNLERLRAALRPAVPAPGSIPEDISEALNRQTEITQKRFIESMDDDFNTAGALGYLFDLVKSINMARDDGLDQETLSTAQDLLRELAEDVFGLRLERAEVVDAQAAPFIDLLVEMRNELREQKLWQLSDMVRDRLLALGILLEDTKDGTSWRWK